ncbi:hypothetical protein C1646_760413 [Rhizophagus diaphanus]|nr:hypothetical protein C1646_760413 [Rhizophagus diaphanus] [Rhizophagus sp. MUCL 43196]
MGIVRLGAKVQQPEWIDKEVWDYLQESVEYTNDTLSPDIEKLFSDLLETNSLVEYSEYLHNIRFDTKNKQMEFAINILRWLGELYLQASANQRLIRRKHKPEDGNPLADNKPFEFGMIELSAENMRQLRAWFLNTHVQEVQVWGMDIPVKKVYRMFLLGAFRFPINWEDHHELLHALPILWNFGKGLNDTVDVLENLKKSHNRNSIISKISELKTYIRHIK